MRNCYVKVGKSGYVSDCEFHYGEDGEIRASDLGVTFQSDCSPAIYDFSHFEKQKR